MPIPMQHTHTLGPLPPTKHLPRPTPQLITPPSTDQNARDNIHHPHQQRQKPATLLPDREQYGLDVKLKEYTRDGVVVDFT